jgi:hypothetical protein
MPGWAQSQGGPLEDQQIEDVTAYILTLDPVEGLILPEPAPEGPLSADISLLLFTGGAILLVVILVVYYRRA